ncbi:MAG TPA: hypothetical protein VGA69_00930 [Nitriliruptorales bacterium]
MLPSALNVPQSNPTQTLEFAPIPPQDDDPPPPQESSNLSSLSLGTSAGPSADAPGGGGGGLADVPPQLPEGAGARPVTKRCVGDPPSQTEDPLSPPCVAHFEGDNGGATARGVTPDEVRVLAYFDGGAGGAVMQAGTSRPTPIPNESFYDLDDPPDYDDEPTYVELIRTYARYFNTRYQTYGRHIHFIVHYGQQDDSPEALRADAAQAEAEYGPFFAVVAYNGGQVYSDAWAQRGTSVFVGTAYTAGATASFFGSHPGMIWGYIPSVEQRAQVVASYICTKAVPHPVSFSGDPTLRGRQRVFGILHTTASQNYIRYAELLRQGIDDCGGEVADVRTFAENSAGGGSPDNGLANMAAFQQAGVTSIVWAGAQDAYQTTSASQIAYYPEWLLAGDRNIEGNIEGRLKDQSQWVNARAVTTYTDMSDIDTAPCFRAAREVRPDLGRIEIRNYGCDFYPDIQQLFTGIQVAGPRLTFASMDQGFHAIPPKPSTSPTTASCFYRSDDYTCVKDSQAQWWDPSGRVPGHNSTGCWRMMERGRRYLAGSWPEGDVEAQRDPSSDPCNAQSREAQ